MSAGEPVPFKLVFGGETKSPAVFGAVGTLTSPLLDSDMHDASGLEVGFADLSPESRAGRPVVHGSQIEALVEYLQQQASIKQALQAALDDHLATWDAKKKLGRGAAVWKKVKVAMLSPEAIEPEPMPSPEPRTPSKTQAVFKVPKALRDKMAARAALAPPRTKFVLVLDTRWNDDHQRMAWFVNGKLDSFNVEG